MTNDDSRRASHPSKNVELNELYAYLELVEITNWCYRLNPLGDHRYRHFVLPAEDCSDIE